MAAAGRHQRWTRTARIPAAGVSPTMAALTTARAGFLKGMWPGKKKDGSDNASEDGSKSPPPPGSSSFFPNLDPQKIAMLQDMLSKQSPEKQKELMQNALKFQQTMTKIPGFKKMAERQSKMMEEAMKSMPSMMGGVPNDSAAPSGQSATNTSSPSVNSGMTTSSRSGPSRSGGHSASRSSGPTLDELKKMNLGDEIEALFEELRVIRHKKNEYRDQCFTMKSQLEDVMAEKARLEKVEHSLRLKLQKSEQEVVLLNSETIDLEDKLKKSNQLRKELELLQRQYDVLKSQTGDEVVKQSEVYKQLAQRMRQKEDVMQSLQRKLQRLRRHDPFLQFSLACSELEKLSTSPSGATADRSIESDRWGSIRSKFEDACERLRVQYHAHQAKAWTAACVEHHAAAKAYSAFCHQFLMSTLPYANYDASVTLRVVTRSPNQSDATGASDGQAREGHRDVECNLEERSKSLVEVFTSFGFEVVAYDEELGQRAEETEDHINNGEVRFIIRSPPHGGLSTAGPYALALAAQLSPPPLQKNDVFSSSTTLLRMDTVVPYVSQQLLQNGDRVSVHFDTARASGPGGQAVNVAETQIHAKVELDGETLFTASAQDSRSAMQNKKVVQDKVEHQKRKQFNDTLSAFTPLQAKKKLQERMGLRGGSAVGTNNAVEVRQELVKLVEQAAEAGAVNPLEVSLARSINSLTA